MSAAQRINQVVTLTSSSNKYLSYPVKGLIEDAEIGVGGQVIWATFRIERDGKLGCPVIVKNFTLA